MKKTLLLLVPVVLLFGCKPTINVAPKTGPTPRPPMLTAAEFFTHTGVDGKEKDTGVYVYVKTKNKATELATAEDVDNSDTEGTSYQPGSDRTIRLNVLSPGSTKENSKNFRVVVRAKAKEADVWKFDARVTLTFSDGTNYVEEKKGIKLESKDGKMDEISFGG